jgi:retron-type reverse transcriptase
MRRSSRFTQISASHNLLGAFAAARRNKRDKPNVAAFGANLEKEIFQLKTELESSAYRPGAYKAFQIYDPKERTISAAPFRDRVVHHALCNLIEPIFEKTFIHDTYANRRHKGSHRGIRRCQQYLRKYRYALKADIRKYFPSIDHAILKQLIRRKIDCPRTLWLIDLIIDGSNPQEEVTEYFAGDDLFTPHERRRGLPMGNLTSQFFANLYLSPLDHFAKETLCLPYLRYVDDFVLFSNDKAELEAARSRIANFLGEQLRLRLHPKKTQIIPCEKGITFLGQRIFRTHRLLRKANVRRFYKRLRKRLAFFRAGKLSPDKLEAQLNSWIGHAKQADTYRLRKKILRQLFFDYGLNVVEAPNGAWKVLERSRSKVTG